MSRRSSLIETLIGQVWDLTGTIVLILGPGNQENYVRCFVLDDEPGVERKEEPLGEWTIRWFNGESKYSAKRIS